MKKILFTGLASVLFLFVLVSPARAQATDIETQKLIVVLLQQITDLQQQLLVLQQAEALANGALVTNPSNPVAIFDTNLGVIEVELFADVMPITVGNFVALVQDGFYAKTKFHRVIDNFMIQGGDPNSKTNDTQRYGTGGPGYIIEDEHISGEFLTNVRGTISMANAGPNSGGSQFFINLVDNKNLDFDKIPLTSQHPVFGHVISGLKVVDTIGAVNTDNRDIPVENVVVESIQIQ